MDPNKSRYLPIELRDVGLGGGYTNNNEAIIKLIDAIEDVFTASVQEQPGRIERLFELYNRMIFCYGDLAFWVSAVHFFTIEKNSIPLF
jgi:hypothetical protein